MTIIALPSDTVRLLGSAVTITSPCDLVKELLDNAIDSRATSVDISISADTVSKVSVRDNGHGIQVADFQALGRNAHTSKLTSFDQLQARAAQTLGFRGVALACASSLAVVYIVTRVLGDPVASRFQLRAGQGGGQSRQPVSAPIGTMVQATHLFKNLPARRHNVVASRHKTLAQIHQLLKSYALARPYLRLSFKVVGDTSQSWSYSPTASSSVKEAVLQIFGVQLARNCAHVATNPCPRESLVFKTDADPVSTLTFDAFIPKRGFDVDAIKDKGVYISVDQRPLSATKGFAKKMVRILKSHLARAGIRTGVSSGPQATPFMHLNITCPPGSYDPNVSPLKDEVLFANEKGLLDSFDEFCRKVYNKEVSMVSYQDSTSQSYAPDTSGMQLASQFSCSSNHRKDSAFLPRLATRRLPTTVNERVDEVSVKTKTPVFRLGTELYEQKTRQQSDAQGSELIEAAMRTIDKVNMARTVSNETDHEFARATVKVKIPPRPANTAASLQRSKAPTFLSEDIHRYFGPKHNNNFLIASDETATSNSVGADGAGTCAAALSKRPPLQSLGNSTLNCLREKTAEALEPALGDAEPEILRPFHLPRGDLDAPFTRRGQSIVDSSPEDGLHASPPHPVDFLEPRAVVPDFGSSPRVIEQSLLPSPPSSNVLRNERHMMAPFRRAGRVEREVYIGPISPPATRRETVGVSRQPRLLSTAPRCGTKRETFVSFGGQAHTRKKNCLSLSIQDYNAEDQESGTGQHHVALQTASWRHDGTDGSSGLPLLNSSNLYSHMTQMLLMRSPSPAGRPDNASSTEPLGAESRPGATRQGTLLSNATLSDMLRPRDPSSDTRQTCMGTGCSAGSGRRTRRQSSKGCPRETIALSQATYNVVGVMNISYSTIEGSVRHLAAVDKYVSYGCLASGLPFKDMVEARLAEEGLRQRVTWWKARNGLDMEVEFTLKTHAKGKQRA